MNEQIGTAVFGLGRAGMIHFQNIISSYRMKLLYIIEKDIKKADDMVAKFALSDVKVLSPDQAHTVYDDVKVKAVVVCAPTYDHEQIVISALQAGKGVFCEKPISQTSEGTKKCYEEAQKAKRPLACSFNRRFDPSLQQLKLKVDAGACGNIMSVKSVARDHPFPPMEYMRISGGFFHDCAVHDLDLICWILNEYPSSVFTMAHAYDKEIKEMGDVDNAAIILKFPSNVIATIDISRHACYGYDQRCEVFGKDGMVVSENQRPTELIQYSKTGAMVEPLKYSFPERYKQSYINALDEFMDVLKGKKENQVSGAHTLKISSLATACEESYKSGQPINLEAVK